MKEFALFFLFSLINVFPIIDNDKPIELIKTRLELMSAIKAAKEGDVLYVDDIDFVSSTDGLYNVYERIDISKNIKIIGKENNSIFNHGSFNLIASKAINQKIDVKFENAIHEAANILDDILKNMKKRILQLPQMNGRMKQNFNMLVSFLVMLMSLILTVNLKVT